MNNASFKAVLFDMDGTILDTEHFTLVAWPDSIREAGYTIDSESDNERERALAIQLVGINEATGNAILKEKFGDDFPCAKIRASMGERYKRLVEKEGIRVKNGFYTLLDAIKAKKLPFVLATSTKRESALWKLERAGLSGVFPRIICGDEITKGKPDPEIFLKAAALAGCNPHDALGIEDSEAGLLSLANAGIRSVFIKDLVTPSAETMRTVWKVCAGLDEVAALLL